MKPPMARLGFTPSSILSIGLATTYHFLAIGVQRVVHDGLCRKDLVIVFVAKVPEAFCDRIQAGRFGLVPEGVVRIGAVHNLGQQHNRGIATKLMSLYECIE